MPFFRGRERETAVPISTTTARITSAPYTPSGRSHTSLIMKVSLLARATPRSPVAPRSIQPRALANIGVASRMAMPSIAVATPSREVTVACSIWMQATRPISITITSASDAPQHPPHFLSLLPSSLIPPLSPPAVVPPSSGMLRQDLLASIQAPPIHRQITHTVPCRLWAVKPASARLCKMQHI